MNLDKIKNLINNIDNLEIDELTIVLENSDLFINPKDKNKFAQTISLITLSAKLIDSGVVCGLPKGMTGEKYMVEQGKEVMKEMFDEKYYQEQLIFREKQTKYNGPLYIKERLSKLNAEQLRKIIILINIYHHNFNLFLSGENMIEFHYYLNQEAVKRDKSIKNFNRCLIFDGANGLKTLEVLPAKVLREAILRYCDLDLVWLDNMLEAYINDGYECASNYPMVAMQMSKQLEGSNMEILR